MQSFLSVYCDHDDFIHDLAFDWYGNRLATCSSDQKVKVFDYINEKWSCTAEIKAHSGSVHKLSWAHPEFGQILASCSADRVVHIYEEQVDGRSGVRTWKKQGRLVDSRDSVQDVEFAPRHLGLKLATGSLDGRVRIYESQDVMNLSVWPLVEEFEAGRTNGVGVQCLAWNASPFDSPQLCVASDREVKLWEYNGNSRRWSSVASLDGHSDLVHDVAWAPNLGRAYHLIATACKDGCVRIYKLTYSKATSQYTPIIVAKLTEHRSEVWRVSWNVSGTILASTGDDGVSRLWKADFNGTWHPILVAAATPNANSNTTKATTSSSPNTALTTTTSGFAAPVSSSSTSTSSAFNSSSMQQPTQQQQQQHLSRLQSAPIHNSSTYASVFNTNTQPLTNNTQTKSTAANSSLFGTIQEKTDESPPTGTSFTAHRSFN